MSEAFGKVIVKLSCKMFTCSREREEEVAALPSRKLRPYNRPFFPF